MMQADLVRQKVIVNVNIDSARVNSNGNIPSQLTVSVRARWGITTLVMFISSLYKHLISAHRMHGKLIRPHKSFKTR